MRIRIVEDDRAILDFLRRALSDAGLPTGASGPSVTVWTGWSSGRMFDRFVKGGASDGHGLGLAFVRAIVCAHGGTVRAGNRTGGGAYVEITLPASRAEGEAVGRLAAGQAEPSGSK